MASVTLEKKCGDDDVGNLTTAVDEAEVRVEATWDERKLKLIFF
jgi:hypothetical protein